MKTRSILTAAAAALALGSAVPAADAASPVAIAGPAIPQTRNMLREGKPGVAVPSRSGKTRMLMFGDSLTVGTMPVIGDVLPGWKIGVVAEGGRPLAWGMDRLAASVVPRTGSTILFMGLFTNDFPWQTDALRISIRESLRRVGPNGCVIWATIHRPAVGGVSWAGALAGDTTTRPVAPEWARGMTYAKANNILRAFAKREPRMRLVRWAEYVDSHPGVLDASQVHPKDYHPRAQMIADAARSC